MNPLVNGQLGISMLEWLVGWLLLLLSHAVSDVVVAAVVPPTSSQQPAQPQ